MKRNLSLMISTALVGLGVTPLAAAQGTLAAPPAKSRPVSDKALAGLKAPKPKPAAAPVSKGYGVTGKVTMTETITPADYKQIEGGPLLLAAYAVVWIVFFAMVLFLFVRMRRITRELRQVEARVAELPEDG